jgi:cellulose synthase/poly-beta-1,6-N-acetylglucosamine synthase-like glycosyltransferase
MAKINYPKDKYEVLVVIRSDDQETLEAAEKTINQLRTNNLASKTDIRIIRIAGQTVNKAYSLNIGLRAATGQIIAVFDAEDEPHPEILKSVDEIFTKRKVDIVQAGVQLINISSFWYSALNCLEYYYWFKSILPFMSSLGATPLGGNTVFFKKKVLDNLGGWSEDCLTEDADIGIRASAAGYQTVMIYVEDMATLEETPANEMEFIRQRTRWDQGYLQILFRGDWLKLPSLKEQFLSFYLLIQPIIHNLSVLAIISLPLVSWGLKVPVGLAMFSWLPLYFLLLQFGLYFMGLKDLKKHYQLQFSPWLYGLLLVFFIPYQFMLAFSSLRAFSRLFLGIGNWEKTYHTNKHRLAMAASEL